MKKAIVISAVIIVSIIAVIVAFSMTQPTPTSQPIKTRVNLTNSYKIVNEKYLILNNGHTIYYNVELTIKIYALDSTVTTRTLKFNQTETLNGVSYTYGIRLPNISASHIDIVSITGETFI